MKYQEGLLPIYYANATVGNSANLTEAIRNARNSERGVLRQMFSNQNYEQTNKVYQELQKKDVKPEEIDDLTKMMKEMEIRLMKKFEGSNGYEKRNRRYDNFDKKEIICYKCKEKEHYASECENRRDIKCNICGKMRHYARVCREKNQSEYNTKNNERHLNYIGIYSSEGSRILDDESSSDEDEEKRVYPISTRSQKYENAGTNTRRNKTDNFQQRKIDKLAENDKRRLNSEFRRELKLLDEDRKDEVMITGNKRMDAIKKALEGKRKKNKCKRCGGIGHFVPDCSTLNEGERKWYGEEVITDLEIIENSDELLILGNDWINKNVKSLNIDNEEMKIRGKYGIQEIPIECTKEVDDEEEEYESEEDIREVYC